MTPRQSGHDSPQLLFRRPALGRIGAARRLVSPLAGDLSRQPRRVPPGTVHGMRATHRGVTILTLMMPARAPRPSEGYACPIVASYGARDRSVRDAPAG